MQEKYLLNSFNKENKLSYLFWQSQNTISCTSCAINPASNSIYMLSDSNENTFMKKIQNPIDVQSYKEKTLVLSREGIIFLDVNTFKESKRLLFPN
jgi:hypothetical protein